MLKYQKLIIGFICIILLLAVADIFFRISFLFYAGTILAFIGILTWGSVNIRSGLYCKTLCSGNMKKRSIALTFDDGPDEAVTPAVLDILSKEEVKAAFFCIGRKAVKNPELLIRMDSEGHVIGGHSFSHHFFFDLFSRERMLEEMRKTEEAVSKSINRKIRMFRPPYGVTNPTLAKALSSKKYKVIGWSLRSKDTVTEDENRLLGRITGKLKPGDIVLFHDTKSQTVNILEKFIKFAKENDYSFERLDKHLGIEAYE
jgi:peptidoglycan/xylan/chitin deacetylase (PgdA/CDA1 family)